MRFARHIVLFTFVLFVISCGGKEGKVIPRGKLAEIYAEMLMVDQWIMSNPGNRHVADTSLVTSGNYERYYTDDGKRYHHIIAAGIYRVEADYYNYRRKGTEQNGIHEDL